jgi:HlyD family secretion protein
MKDVVAIAKILISWVCITGIGACSAEIDTSAPIIEVMQRADFTDRLSAQGELKSAQTTPLNVPGSGFEQRRLEFLVEDGARVKKGDLLARFNVDSARKDLSQQELELLRYAFKIAGEKAQSDTAAAQILTEQAAILGDLELSQRYADLDESASWVSKNELLDKLQDLDLLENKQSTAGWRLQHQKRREAAGAEVTLAQKNSVQANVDRYRESLAALELYAPHDGVFRLNTNWDGSKLQVGGSTWAGDDFANLPDLSSLVARFSLPQAAATGLQIGQRVDIRLSGTGQTIQGKISRVGASASVKSRESPVKFLEFDASFDSAEIARLQLTPGMAVSGEVFRIEAKQAITVSNTALELAPKINEAPKDISTPGFSPRGTTSGTGNRLTGARSANAAGPNAAMRERLEQRSDSPSVTDSPKSIQPQEGTVLLADGTERKVSIGAQGSARSVVLSGLEVGEQVLLLRPEQGSKASSPSATP